MSNFDRVRAMYGNATAWSGSDHADRPDLLALRESALAEFDEVMAQHDAQVRTKALHEAAEFVDSQRYIDEPADLRQVRDRLHGVADGTWEVEAP